MTHGCLGCMNAGGGQERGSPFAVEEVEEQKLADIACGVLGVVGGESVAVVAFGGDAIDDFVVIAAVAAALCAVVGEIGNSSQS